MPCWATARLSCRAARPTCFTSLFLSIIYFRDFFSLEGSFLIFTLHNSKDKAVPPVAQSSLSHTCCKRASKVQKSKPVVLIFSSSNPSNPHFHSHLKVGPTWHLDQSHTHTHFPHLHTLDRFPNSTYPPQTIKQIQSPDQNQRSGSL